MLDRSAAGQREDRCGLRRRARCSSGNSWSWRRSVLRCEISVKSLRLLGLRFTGISARGGPPEARCPSLDGKDAQGERQRMPVELGCELGDLHDPAGQPVVVVLAMDLDSRVALALAPPPAVVVGGS